MTSEVGRGDLAETRSAGLPTEKLLTAIVALMAADREERIATGAAKLRPEIILAAAGMTMKEISYITGKEYQAVRSTLRRSGAAGEKKRTP